LANATPARTASKEKEKRRTMVEIERKGLRETNNFNKKVETVEGVRVYFPMRPSLIPIK
jgi:hypothetical protein